MTYRKHVVVHTDDIGQFTGEVGHVAGGNLLAVGIPAVGELGGGGILVSVTGKDGVTYGLLESAFTPGSSLSDIWSFAPPGIVSLEIAEADENATYDVSLWFQD